jgi:hypothetical protein
MCSGPRSPERGFSLCDIADRASQWRAYAETMKVILLTITLVCAYAFCMVQMPGVTHAFDKRWDCSSPFVCIKKS